MSALSAVRALGALIVSPVACDFDAMSLATHCFTKNPRRLTFSETASGGRLIVVVVEQVHIVTYDPSWPTLFAEERNRILEAVGQWVEEIKHVGSTAIPSVDAKPVIDLDSEPKEHGGR